jgi:hypothetical protein
MPSTMASALATKPRTDQVARHRAAHHAQAHHAHCVRPHYLRHCSAPHLNRKRFLLTAT